MCTCVRCVLLWTGVEVSNSMGSEDKLLNPDREKSVTCNCALCDSPRRRMAWACCCCSVFIIILSFVLAIVLPIAAFINGAKLRLVHVRQTNECLGSCRNQSTWNSLLAWGNGAG